MKVVPVIVLGSPSVAVGLASIASEKVAVKLMKAGTTTAILAIVTYDPNTNKAILNPNANLKLGTKDKAAVTTGAEDLAGNRLDQDQDPSNGLQQKGWSFTIKN